MQCAYFKSSVVKRVWSVCVGGGSYGGAQTFLRVLAIRLDVAGLLPRHRRRASAHGSTGFGRSTGNDESRPLLFASPVKVLVSETRDAAFLPRPFFFEFTKKRKQNKRCTVAVCYVRGYRWLG